MGNWRPLPATPLWWINTQDSNALWLFIFLIHVVAWVLIYSAALTMDFAELTGLKQVLLYLNLNIHRSKLICLTQLKSSSETIKKTSHIAHDNRKSLTHVFFKFHLGLLLHA